MEQAAKPSHAFISPVMKMELSGHMVFMKLFCAKDLLI